MPKTVPAYTRANTEIHRFHQLVGQALHTAPWNGSNHASDPINAGLTSQMEEIRALIAQYPGIQNSILLYAQHGSNCYTTLHFAQHAQTPYKDAVVRDLLALGVDPTLDFSLAFLRHFDTEKDGDKVTSERAEQIIKDFVGQGGDINFAHPYSGETALHRAAYCGNTSVMAVLLESGAKIDATMFSTKTYPHLSGSTALQISISVGNVDAVRLCLEKGADLSIPSKHGCDIQEVIEIFYQEATRSKKIRSVDTTFAIIRELIEQRGIEDVKKDVRSLPDELDVLLNHWMSTFVGDFDKRVVDMVHQVFPDATVKLIGSDSESD